MKYKTKMLGTVALAMLNPAMRKKTGLNIEIFNNWQHIVGTDIAKLCLPVKLKWNGNSKIASLLLSAFGGNATIVMHYNLEIIEKVNRFFGYYAIDKIKITQAVIHYESSNKSRITQKTKPHILTEYEEQKIQDIASIVKDKKLRHILLQLGRSIYKNKTIIES